MSRLAKGLILLGTLPGLVFALLVGLRICGLIRPFSIPTGAMVPAISPGDHVLMEAFTFHVRKPHRGDLVVFKGDGLPLLRPEIYVKRIAGEPGEQVRVSDGALWINGQRTAMSNQVGQVSYTLPEPFRQSTPYTELTVPPGRYYVLGDNPTNSLDSRYWGCLPARNVIGRIWFCYWPPGRIGVVK
jgi:signal peptidase I